MFSLGKEEECQNSLRIIERTKKPSPRPTKTTKPSVQSFDDDDEEMQEDEEEEDEEEEDRRSQEESEIDKENDCRGVDEFNDAEVVEKEPDNSRKEGLALISANTLPTQEASKSLNRCKRNCKTISLRLQVPSSVRKRKNSFMDQPNLVNQKRAMNIGFVSLKEHAKVVDQLAPTHSQIEAYQSTWMRKCLN